MHKAEVNVFGTLCKEKKLNSDCFYEYVKIVNDLRRRLGKYSNMSVQRKITKSLIKKNSKS